MVVLIDSRLGSCHKLGLGSRLGLRVGPRVRSGSRFGVGLGSIIRSSLV